jgi:hypothetical protein
MPIQKFAGRDCELSTTGIDPGGVAIKPWDVTRAVLERIGAAFEPFGLRAWNEDVPRGASGGGYRGGYGSAYSADCLRHWLPNSQCVYSDMSHVEVALGAALHPRRFAAQSIAALRVVEAARRRAEAESPDGTSYSLSTSNVDALDPSISWGSHLNLSVSEDLWTNLFLDHRHPGVFGFVASALAAAIPFFGAGYLLPLRDGVVYSLSGRAHHITRMTTSATTEAFGRGLLNSRREPHAEGQDRLHLIGFDYSLASAALLCSFLQCCLAAAEEGFGELTLFDPVRATRTWSWGLDLATGRLDAVADLVDGRRLTLCEYLREITGRLLRLCDARTITDEVAPGAQSMLARILELAERAGRGDIQAVARHLDWAAKLVTLVEICREDGAALGDATTRLADHDFASTHESAPFWRLWERGLIDPLIDESRVTECLRDGPPEARGWARGRILQKLYDDVTDVDWSYVELRRDASRWGPRLRIEMPRPGSLNRAIFHSVVERAESVGELEELLRTRAQREKSASVGDRDPVLDISSLLELAPQDAAPGSEAGSEDRAAAGPLH